MGTRLVVVGGGRMGEALVGGLLSARWGDAEELCLVENRAERRQQLTERFPGVAVMATPPPAQGVVLAVKPADVVETAAAVARAGFERAVSIAAGVPLATLEASHSAEAGRRPVLRAMPNTPALVGAGAAAVSAGTWAGESDLAWAEGVLAAVGTVVRVSEPLLDAVTGLSGSGPAYLFLVAEAMTDAGVLVGLPHDVSRALTIQTLLGSARLLAETDEPAAVVPPGEVTAARSAAAG